MVNCALFQHSIGNEFCIITDDDELRSFAQFWEIRSLSAEELEDTASKLVQKYYQDLKAYQMRQRTAHRSSIGKQRTLWTPPK